MHPTDEEIIKQLRGLYHRNGKPSAYVITRKQFQELSGRFQLKDGLIFRIIESLRIKNQYQMLPLDGEMERFYVIKTGTLNMRVLP